MPPLVLPGLQPSTRSHCPDQDKLLRKPGQRGPLARAIWAEGQMTIGGCSIAAVIAFNARAEVELKRKRTPRSAVWQDKGRSDSFAVRSQFRLLAADNDNTRGGFYPK